MKQYISRTSAIIFPGIASSYKWDHIYSLIMKKLNTYVRGQVYLALIM